MQLAQQHGEVKFRACSTKVPSIEGVSDHRKASLAARHAPLCFGLEPPSAGESSSQTGCGRITGSSGARHARPRRFAERHFASIACCVETNTLVTIVTDAVKALQNRAQKLNDSVKHLACGGVSAVVSRSTLAPLERVKMEVLLNQDMTNWQSAIGHIWGKGGVLGFWKGNLLNCIRTAPFKAVNYFTFDKLHGAIKGSEALPTGSERFFAGAGAGLAATVLCFPLDVIRTRMLTPPHDMNVLATVLAMAHTEGLGSFYTGCAPACVSMAIGGAVFYGVYDVLKTRHLIAEGRTLDTSERRNGLDLSPQYTLLYGGLSGMSAEVMTYPFEVVRRKMQLDCVLASRAARAALQQGNGIPPVVQRAFVARVRRAVELSIQKHGFPGLYAGMLPNMLQVMPSSAIAYFVYETSKVILDVRA